MKLIASLCVIGASAPVCLATAFSIGAIDASDGTVVGGRPGTGIDIVGGMIYQNAFASPSAVAEPNAAFLVFEPNLEFDSYLTVDSAPVGTFDSG